MAENYLQHAEHYYRLIMAYQSHMQAQQGQGGQPYGNAGGQSHASSGQQGQPYGNASGPYRNPQGAQGNQQPGGQGGNEPNGNVYDASGNGNGNGSGGTNGHGHANGNGNGNGNGEAIVSHQDDVYNEEDSGRYD